MSSVTLHPRQISSSTTAQANPLPQLLQTPSGLAILELQGTINLPGGGAEEPLALGRLDFPDYRADALDPSSTAWMRRVYLYVGRHQRLAGEVKKLAMPLAVVRRCGDGADGETPEELQVVELVKYKLVFSQRPEPIGASSS